MKTLKYIVSLFLLTLVPALAADKFITAAVSATTPVTVLTGGKYTIKSILFLPTSTNGTIWAYDSASNLTNYVQPAYTSYAKYATNYSVTFTNAAGIVMTNTFVGEAILPTSVGASTNERPKILGPGLYTTSGRTFSDLRLQPALGLTFYSSAAGNVEVVYEQNSP